ncbi:TetR family transcriptional regulator [Granulicella sp. 5B5]|uniref:TetR/AcrR family transcriptional regulator n=1 Tax=Granulicella sp. 5B5 TaxID=1617967 RepID=UPI0015F4B707|nr:TetR/AcrR family transcriptional regulator [Granulicella sp. 5B5]QMV18506.1 TetR family transcriptional regulator [Granulicella sp. 5B5]
MPSHTVERGVLRARLIEVAGKLLTSEGYEALSMRRVAQEAGCSQMAVYRHFANKEALTQHLCSMLYTDFVVRVSREMEIAEDPWEKLRLFIVALIRFATRYPDHYSLVFLVRHSNPEVVADRERLGAEFLRKVREIVRGVLPAEVDDVTVNMRLRQVVACLHGTAALLIAHPKAYDLTRQRAIDDVEATFRKLLLPEEAAGAQP